MDINKIKSAKYFHRSIILLVSIFAIILCNLFAPDYTRQVDSRKREYCPATVVDKNRYQSCSKRNCNVYNNFIVQLSDGSYEKIPVSEETYYGYAVGDTVSFERHLTDPSVVRDNRILLFIMLSWMSCVFLVVLRAFLNWMDKW